MRKLVALRKNKKLSQRRLAKLSNVTHVTIARIETLSDNAIGAHLYPSVGFELVTTQNHYAMRLD